MSTNLNQVHSPQQTTYAQSGAHAPLQHEVHEFEKAAQKKVEKTEEQQVSETLINKRIKEINESLRPYSRYIEREVHEVTRSIMYRLKNSTTDEVIDEFPPSRIQDLVAKIWELAGLFVDEKA